MSENNEALAAELLEAQLKLTLYVRNDDLRLQPAAISDVTRNLLAGGVNRCSEGTLITAGGQDVVEYVNTHMRRERPYLFLADTDSASAVDYSKMSAAEKLSRINGDRKPKL